MRYIPSVLRLLKKYVILTLFWLPSFSVFCRQLLFRFLPFCARAGETPCRPRPQWRELSPFPHLRRREILSLRLSRNRLVSLHRHPLCTRNSTIVSVWMSDSRAEGANLLWSWYKYSPRHSKQDYTPIKCNTVARPDDKSEKDESKGQELHHRNAISERAKCQRHLGSARWCQLTRTSPAFLLR